MVPRRGMAGACVGTVAPVAQLVEHVLGKDEVSGSIPLVGSIFSDGDARLKVEKRKTICRN